MWHFLYSFPSIHKVRKACPPQPLPHREHDISSSSAFACCCRVEQFRISQARKPRWATKRQQVHFPIFWAHFACSSMDMSPCLLLPRFWTHLKPAKACTLKQKGKTNKTWLVMAHKTLQLANTFEKYSTKSSRHERKWSSLQKDCLCISSTSTK